jgi:ABC-type bacteriocin/lantibiotic exporter with double-glycine peptidase domain
VKNPQILVIEEPLSALDYESQKRIFDNIKKLRTGKNLIWIFSDDRLSPEFDRVLTLGANTA